MPKEPDRVSSLRKRVAHAPSDPGIYKWLDENGRVLYVGKAKNLRKRLGSYVSPAKKSDGPWKESFKEQITDFDVTVTNSELEALLLETNLIKQLRPKYNVLMKDDKNYLFIRVSLKDEYPRVETTRRFEHDRAKYFGPYLNSFEAYQSLDLLHEALAYRACAHSTDALNRNTHAAASLKPCLEFQIGRCNGLCAGKINKEEYQKRIEQVIDFLKGRKDNVKAILLERMKAAATDRKFELAAKLRNYLALIDGTREQKQIATDTTGEDCDILGVAILSDRAHVVIMHRRNGRLIGDTHFALSGHAIDAGSVIEQFLPQFYDNGREIPDTVLIPEAPEDDAGVLEELLRDRRGKSVRVIIPERGRKSQLLQLAERNAREKARQMELKWEAEERNTKGALEELAELLNLKSPPRRIEGYDISHLGGTETVGSMVVMKDGKAANDLYRSFTIRTLKSGQVDDYKAIREVLARRMRRLTEDLPQEEKKWNAEGVSFGKALKKDQKAIEEIHAANASDMSDKGIDYKNYLVARHGGEIVGFGRLIKHPQGITEMKSIWVNESFRGGRLGQFIVRKILRSVKKGKVYCMCNPELEEYYARIGFRYVITPPKVLADATAAFVKKNPDQPLGVVLLWEAHQNKVDPSLTARPDLIVIDGGKGQLSTAVDVLKIYQSDIPVIGLAKREEEIFIPGKSDPIPCPAESPAKFLLMRLRDEAHRFSNAHREKRAKNAMTASSLDEIPGLGELTMKQLLARFGSISAMRKATDNELQEILNETQIKNIRESQE
ncbi:MAG: excinuclease ABC subunit UvrC [Candidatus Peribacteraceae bacterium]|nr:excinuclease ABC subunit UvrC [Candidatus Peribacteraceae bacterium]